jgi:hypothetical protein
VDHVLISFFTGRTGGFQALKVDLWPVCGFTDRARQFGRTEEVQMGGASSMLCSNASVLSISPNLFFMCVAMQHV